MWHDLVSSFIYGTMGFQKGERFTEALHFFIYDTGKIFFLLLIIIFAVTLLRSYFKLEKVRHFLSGKKEITGNILASLLGIVTPFCSCSAIPLFLGFLQARIPLGVTLSFLISAPMNNEIAIAMLFGLFGWKIAALYIAFGLFVSISAGFILGKMNMEKYILLKVEPIDIEGTFEDEKIPFYSRIKESWEYTGELIQKIWLYVVLGIAVGGFIHGYVPTEFIATYAGGRDWYSVPLAVLIGIPMYSNAAGVMPLVEVLTAKGMAMGTALALMMSIIAISPPEAIILKRVLHVRLIAIYFSVVAIGIICVGYIFNWIL